MGAYRERYGCNRTAERHETVVEKAWLGWYAMVAESAFSSIQSVW